MGASEASRNCEVNVDGGEAGVQVKTSVMATVMDTGRVA